MKKAFSLILLLAVLTVLVSCNKLHADVVVADVFYRDGVPYDPNGEIFFTEPFLSETRVREWNSAETPDGLPETRTVVIGDRATCDETFTDCPFDVDFDSEMIVIYVTGSIYVRPIRVKDTALSDGVLKINLSAKKSGSGADAASPHERYVVIKLDKVDFDRVDVGYKE